MDIPKSFRVGILKALITGLTLLSLVPWQNSHYLEWEKRQVNTRHLWKSKWNPPSCRELALFKPGISGTEVAPKPHVFGLSLEMEMKQTAEVTKLSQHNSLEDFWPPHRINTKLEKFQTDSDLFWRSVVCQSYYWVILRSAAIVHSNWETLDTGRESLVSVKCFYLTIT